MSYHDTGADSSIRALTWVAAEQLPPCSWSEYRFDNARRAVKDGRVAALAALTGGEMTDNSGWLDDAGRSWVDDLIDSDPRIRDKIQQWWDTTPPEPMVGSRHHTVPRSYLERFAAGGKIYVRDRVTGTGGLRSVKDTGAIKDFYTGINLSGQLDGRLERSSPTSRAVQTPCSAAFSARSSNPGQWIRMSTCTSASSSPSSWCEPRGTAERWS